MLMVEIRSTLIDFFALLFLYELTNFVTECKKSDVDQFEVVGPLDKTSPRPIRTTATETELSTCNHISGGPIGQTHPNNDHPG